jgi:mono/diheme cytochrome c family protein
MPYDLPNDGELMQKVSAVHARRCAGCHQPGEVTRTDWIDFRQPKASRFLAAPIAKASGQGKCPGYRDANDADYRAVLGLVESAVQKAWEAPRRDLKGLKPEHNITSLER